MSAPATTGSWSTKLTDLLVHQQDLVRRLHDLATRQAGLINAGHAEALLGLLSRRQAVIDEFVETQTPLAELTHDMDSRLAALPAATRTRLRGLIDGISVQLAEVMTADERDGETLQALRDERRDQLGQIDVTRTARAAYLGTSSSRSRFADRKG